MIDDVVDLVQLGERVGDRLERRRRRGCRPSPGGRSRAASGSVTATICITPLSVSRWTRWRTAASERPTTLPIAAYERRPSCWSCSMIAFETSSRTWMRCRGRGFSLMARIVLAAASHGKRPGLTDARNRVGYRCVTIPWHRCVVATESLVDGPPRARSRRWPRSREESGWSAGRRTSVAATARVPAGAPSSRGRASPRSGSAAPRSSCRSSASTGAQAGPGDVHRRRTSRPAEKKLIISNWPAYIDPRADGPTTTRDVFEDADRHHRQLHRRRQRQRRVLRQGAQPARRLRADQARHDRC